MSKRKVFYAPNEFITIESLTDEIRFAKCVKLYEKYESIEALDNALNQIYQGH